jgi:hypothetical protein
LIKTGRKEFSPGFAKREVFCFGFEELAERFENEPALVHPWMRNRELGPARRSPTCPA